MLMPKQRWAGGICLSLLFFTTFAGMGLMADQTAELYQKLPDSIANWKKVAPPTAYTPANLSNYIDGGAELYISYNFQGALAGKYLNDTNEEISVDIFDMGTSADAFGVFAHTRETIDDRIGQGCEYASGLLTFWKDRFYVSILAYPETAKKKEIVLQLGLAIAGAIGNTGSLPPIIAQLPTAGLIPASVRYFHHYIWLNSYRFVANDNVLEIGADTPAALGKYRRGGGSFFLLLIRYGDAVKAGAARERFCREILGGAADGMKQTADGSWTGCRQLGKRVCVVLQAPDTPTICSMFAAIEP